MADRNEPTAPPDYRVKRHWHLGETVNFQPYKDQMTEHAGVETFVLRGLTPEAPFIHENAKITAFGSCFAQHISNHLNKRSFIVLNKQERRSYVVHFNNEMVHTFSIKQQFDWVLRGAEFSQTLWHSKAGDDINYDENVRRQTRELFDQTDVFIFTLGLSEIWHDTQTEEVFWRTVPEDEFDPERHKFRLTTVEENFANLKSIYETIMEYRPDAKIILTLSPIPLNATFREIGCVAANSVSKAILRVAIDQMLRTYGSNGNLFYYPAYEIVREVFRDSFEADNRHVKVPIIHYIMCCFERFFCKSNVSAEFLEVAYAAAASADRDPAPMYSDQTLNLSAAADNAHFIEYQVNHLIGQGQSDKALALAKRAAMINAVSGQSQFLLGLMLNREGKTVEACNAFAAAARLSPGLAKIRRELAMALLRLGRHTEALSQFEIALAGGENDFALLHHLAGCLYAVGNFVQAEQVQAVAVARNPDHEGARQQLAAIQAARAAQQQPVPA